MKRRAQPRFDEEPHTPSTRRKLSKEGSSSWPRCSNDENAYVTEASHNREPQQGEVDASAPCPAPPSPTACTPKKKPSAPAKVSTPKRVLSPSKKQNQASPSVLYAAPSTENVEDGTVVVFDWDDTLLPSTHLSTMGHGILTDAPFGDTLQAELNTLEDQVINLLKLAIDKVGAHRVTIITNAEQGWVELSAQKFIPGVLPILEECHVISARTTFESASLPSPFDWKLHCFWYKIQQTFGLPLPRPPVSTAPLATYSYAKVDIQPSQTTAPSDNDVAAAPPCDYTTEPSQTTAAPSGDDAVAEPTPTEYSSPPDHPDLDYTFSMDVSCRGAAAMDPASISALNMSLDLSLNSTTAAVHNLGADTSREEECRPTSFVFSPNSDESARAGEETSDTSADEADEGGEEENGADDDHALHHEKFDDKNSLPGGGWVHGPDVVRRDNEADEAALSIPRPLLLEEQNHLVDASTSTADGPYRLEIDLDEYTEPGFTDADREEEILNLRLQQACLEFSPADDMEAVRNQKKFVISLGDSFAEKNAASEVCRVMENTMLKSVKFIQQPTITELNRQISLLFEWMHYVLDVDRPLDIVLALD